VFERGCIPFHKLRGRGDVKSFPWPYWGRHLKVCAWLFLGFAEFALYSSTVNTLAMNTVCDVGPTSESVNLEVSFQTWHRREQHSAANQLLFMWVLTSL
jgi:hypothetical protein